MIGTILREDKLMNKDTNQNRNSARNPSQEHNRRPNTGRAPSPNRPPKKDEKASYFSNEQKQTLKLVGVLTVCVIILLILSIALMNSFATPTVNNEPKYIDIDNIEGMNVNEAIEILKKAEITYEIIPTDSKIPNRVEKLEYVGLVLSDTGRLRIRVGTNVKIYSNVVGKDKIIYLTFDDGPTRDNTNDIVFKLQEYGIIASFFVEGRDVERYPDRMEAIFNRGHLIACHSHTHEYSQIYSSTDAFLEEIAQYESAMIEAIGEENFAQVKKIIRFPGGTNNSYLNDRQNALSYISAVRGLGYAIYDWTALTGDAELSDKSPQNLISYLDTSLKKAKSQGLDLIVLMHDNVYSNEALIQILDYLVAEGYYFDTIDNCPEYTFVEN
jgi:peptidoglycan/xylan/chitin deacetylase (PgdA/CDA1 family)